MAIYNFKSRKELELDQEQLQMLGEEWFILKDAVTDATDNLNDAITELKDFEERWELNEN